MSRREAIASAALVAFVALVVRLWAATVVTFPAPEDTAYYVGVARNLVEGRGLVSDAIWSYGTPPLVFPRPAFEVWLPLPSLLAAIPMALVGTTFAAAQWSSVIVGTLVCVLAWRLGADLAAARDLPRGRARALALGTGLGSAVYLPLVLFSALPDSTMPFAATVLGAGLLMARILGRATTHLPPATDRTLLALGAVLGLAALTRNEAAWLALAWAVLAAGAVRGQGGPAAWLRLVVPVAVVSLAVFAPWAIREWLVFGSPLPGQALTNALSLDGFDIFAWSEPPTLERYLAAGPPTLLGLRATAFWHDLWSVLLVTGIPVSLVGLAGLGGLRRDGILRPLLVFALLDFTLTTLVFPVATTWGTFLHSAGAIHVLLVVGAAATLDSVLAAVARRRGWTRPTAWLGSALVVAPSLLFSIALLPGFSGPGDTRAARFAALPDAVRAAGLPFAPAAGPVITDFPIWLAEETGVRALALPDEPPVAVLDLARAFPGTKLVVVEADKGGLWPTIAGTDPIGRQCFEPVALAPVVVGGRDVLASTRVFRIICP